MIKLTQLLKQFEAPKPLPDLASIGSLAPPVAIGDVAQIWKYDTVLHMVDQVRSCCLLVTAVKACRRCSLLSTAFFSIDSVYHRLPSFSFKDLKILASFSEDFVNLQNLHWRIDSEYLQLLPSLYYMKVRRRSDRKCSQLGSRGCQRLFSCSCLTGQGTDARCRMPEWFCVDPQVRWPRPDPPQV